MKTTLTLAILLLTLAGQGQNTGLKLGPSASAFTFGDANYSGPQHVYVSITAGIYRKTKHFQYEIAFQQMGAKNPFENDRIFKTYYAIGSAAYVAHAGPVNFQFGAYLAKLIGASNSDFYSPGINWGWTIGENWKWFESIGYGALIGAGVNLHPVYLEAHWKQGINNVRRDKNGWDGRYDGSYMGCRNSAIDLSLYIPFNVFKP